MDIATPDWVKDAVFYAIFPDRFASSRSVPKPGNLEPWDAPPTLHGFKGGDLIGVVEHLDYLQDLGVNALYLNPVFQSAANHRYHTHDYFRVDPILGGDPALRRLLDEAHARGFRVMLDAVLNHAGRGFYQFNHLLETGEQSPYVDWFRVHEWPVRAYGDGSPNYDAWWGIAALPKFNTDTPAVREFLWSVGQHWMEWGIDGWRLDVPTDIADDSFWQEFRRRVKAINPEAYLLAEIWHEAAHWLKGDQFDATMNYLFTKACIGLFAGKAMDRALTEGKGYSPVPALDAVSFADAIDHLLGLYDPEVNLAQFNLLGSHDTARFLSIAREDESALRLATLFQFTFMGTPSVYYGDEVGLTGASDPDCRKGMPWDEAHWNIGLRRHVQECARLRREHVSLRRGGYTRLYARDRVAAFARRYEGETLLIVLNAGKHTATPAVPMADVLPDGTRLDHLWHAHGAHIVRGGLLHDLKLAPRSGAVLKAAA